jgi:FixJ family two-component response regulator
MTGAQLADRVRERDPSLPVVMVSGYADLAAGGSGDLPRLAKPFSQGALTDILAQALKRARA